MRDSNSEHGNGSAVCLVLQCSNLGAIRFGDKISQKNKQKANTGITRDA